ncbi:hypothetical protein F975_03065 [Acinetobacter sp. ANC 3789]|nr:hypothetical protein F975_03065 [Acinetobacter sp. ANC 3789]
MNGFKKKALTSCQDFDPRSVLWTSGPSHYFIEIIENKSLIFLKDFKSMNYFSEDPF